MPVGGDGHVPERMWCRKHLFDSIMNIPDTDGHGSYNCRRDDGFHKENR